MFERTIARGEYDGLFICPECMFVLEDEVEVSFFGKCECPNCGEWVRPDEWNGNFDEDCLVWDAQEDEAEDDEGDDDAEEDIEAYGADRHVSHGNVPG